MLLSLVIPVYRNEASVDELLVALAGLHDVLAGALEVVFVVDGSPDRSFERLRAQLPRSGLRARLILLTRNFGAFAAVRAGMRHARGDAFAVMAADLQEPPELVLRMAEILRADTADVVIAERTARADPFWARLQARIFWGLYRRFVVPEMPAGGVDVFACNRPFRDALLQLDESRSSLIAQIFWLGFRRASVPYERRARHAGKSAWTWRKRVAYLADSVFAFSDLPIRALTWAGAAGVLAALILAVLVVAGRLSGAIHVPGYAMTLVAILFFGALNLFGLGVVGTYAWRAYENTKRRPLALAQRVLDFGYEPDEGDTDSAPGVA